MDGGAHAANASYEYPSIARVAVAYYVFYSAYHRTGTVSVFNLAAFDDSFYPQMAFDTGDRVYNDSFRHGNTNLDVRLTFRFVIVDQLLLADIGGNGVNSDTGCCAAPRARPIWSAVASIPKPWTSGIRL